MNLVHGPEVVNSLHNTTPVFCRTWSSKLTLNHILCLPVSKDYKTKPSSWLKYLHAYTYPSNGVLIAFHVPVFLKLEKKLSSEEKGMVFQASWSDYSNSIQCDSGLALTQKLQFRTALGMHIATLALTIVPGMCSVVTLSMELLQEEIFSVSAMFTLLGANQTQ